MHPLTEAIAAADDRAFISLSWTYILGAPAREEMRLEVSEQAAESKLWREVQKPPATIAGVPRGRLQALLKIHIARAIITGETRPFLLKVETEKLRKVVGRIGHHVGRPRSRDRGKSVTARLTPWVAYRLISRAGVERSAIDDYTHDAAIDAMTIIALQLVAADLEAERHGPLEQTAASAIARVLEHCADLLTITGTDVAGCQTLRLLAKRHCGVVGLGRPRNENARAVADFQTVERLIGAMRLSGKKIRVEDAMSACLGRTSCGDSESLAKSRCRGKRATARLVRRIENF